MANDVTATGNVKLASSAGTISVMKLAGQDLDFSASGNLSANDVTATGNVKLASSTGAISVAKLSGQDFDFSASGNLSADDVAATGNVKLASSAGTISVMKLAGQDLDFSASGNLSADDVTATGNVKLASSAGDIIATDQSTSIHAGGALVLTAGGDIRLGAARSGARDTLNNATTMIEALDGVIVIESLAAAGPVTATAHSITIRGSGDLLFQQLNADDGNINVRSDGSLSLIAGDATGDVTLASSAGTISVAKLSGQDLDFSANGNLSADDVTATGNVKLASSAGDIIATDQSTSIQAGGALMLTAGGDIRLGAARSGARDTLNNATTMIEALDGVIVIESLAAAGLVTATAHSITIRGSGDLFFQQLSADDGNINVRSDGSLSLIAGDATGDVTLASSAGTISVAKLSGQALDFSASGNLSAGDVTATGNVKLASSAGDIIATDQSTSIQAGGALVLTADGNIRLETARSGARDTPNNATTMIEALDGVIVIESLAAAGPVTATAHSITIRGSGDLFFQQLNADDGNINVRNDGSLSVTAAMPLACHIASSAGTISVAKLSGQDLDFSASGDLMANDVTATGNVTLASSAGTISVAKLSGQALDFSASGNLSADDVTATGNVKLASSAGAISVMNLAGQDLDFSASGNLSADDVTATGNVKLASSAGDIIATDQSTSIQAGGALVLTAGGNIRLGTARSGARDTLNNATTMIEALDGVIVIESLAAAGPVTATAHSITIRGSGDLFFQQLSADDGNINVRSDGSLSLIAGDATGDVTLASSAGTISVAKLSGQDFDFSASGNLNADDVTTTGNVTLASSAGTISVMKLAGQDLDFSASGNLSANDVTATGNVKLASSTGAISVAKLSGQDFDFSASGNLSADDVTATGNVTLASSAGDIIATDQSTSIHAGGALVLTAGGDIRLGAARSGARDTLNNATTMIEALDGVIVIESLAAAGPVTATAHNITIRGSGDLLFQQLNADDGNINVRSDGSLSLIAGDATGDVTLASSAGTISVMKLAGQDLDFSASGNLSANDVTATGNVKLASSTGAISVAKLSGQDLDFSASGNLSADDVTATGNVTLASSAGDIIATDQSTSIQAGGALVLTAGGDIRLGTARSGARDTPNNATTMIESLDGVIVIESLAAAGPVTATAHNITIRGSGDLFFQQLSADDGNINVRSDGSLSLIAGDATGDVTLASSAGTIFVAKLSGQDFDFSASGNLNADDVTTTGNVTLASSAGTISVMKLAGQDLDFSASGNLSANDVTATGNVTLASSAGDIIATDQSTSIQAGGALVLTAGGDIRLGTARSGARDTPNNATTMIESLDGVIVIESLAAAGPVTATAHNITIRGSGDLFFQQLSADDGNINVRSDGSLSLIAGDATGDVTLASSAGTIFVAKLSGQDFDFSASGNLNADDVTATGDVKLASSAGDIIATDQSTSIQAGGALVLTAGGDIRLGAARSGARDTLNNATTMIEALDGVIVIESLAAAGPVTATAHSITIRGSGDLFFQQLNADDGNINVRSNGSLSLIAGDATGDVTLASSAGTISVMKLSGQDLDFSASGNLSADDVTATGDVTLASSAGAISVMKLAGQDLDFSASGNLSADDVTATGNVKLASSAGDIIATDQSTSIQAGSALMLTAGGDIRLGAARSGARDTLNNATTMIEALDGVIVIESLAAARPVTATAHNITIRGSGDLFFQQLSADDGNINVRSDGSLSLIAGDATVSHSHRARGLSLS